MSEKNIIEGFGEIPEEDDMSVESVFGSQSGVVDEALPVVQEAVPSGSSADTTTLPRRNRRLKR